MLDKQCIETVDYGFSTYTIIHTVCKLNVPNDISLTLTIGQGSHDVGALPPTLVTRVYQYDWDKFPISIRRDANHNEPNFIDQYLIFERTKDLAKN